MNHCWSVTLKIPKYPHHLLRLSFPMFPKNCNELILSFIYLSDCFYSGQSRSATLGNTVYEQKAEIHPGWDGIQHNMHQENMWNSTQAVTQAQDQAHIYAEQFS